MSSPELPEDGALRVLGIEGTAWAASAALFETPDPAHSHPEESVVIESDPYEPDSGGIHPREAAEHMSDAVPAVVETILAEAESRATGDGVTDDEAPIDAVAFSRGPGLGPCLRIVATAARALAQRYDVPLVGVNHMVAHLEIGRHTAGFDDPVCLNASGANAHVLGFRGDRYRVLGETMDAGVGNAIDKFTRHVGWSHPGGPKVEERALEGNYVALPYVVKGMDFSFSGLASAAKQAYDDSVPIEDVCRGLEETVFAMLTEVSERALALTGRDELVVGGGVAQNERLRSMLATMCESRGAEFHAPDPRFLRDNAGMIAVLGAKMYAAGDTIAIDDSRVDSDFRPDQVPVTWREPSSGDATRRSEGLVQGAEARVSIADGVVRKQRLPREYRHPDLDERLRTERTRREAKATSEARRVGVPTPLVRNVDLQERTLTLQAVGDADLRDAPSGAAMAAVGRHLARLHAAGIVHGDPTVRNVRVQSTAHSAHDGNSTPDTFLIDFGLSYDSHDAEDHAMDLHVLAGSVRGVADDPEPLVTAATDAYADEREDADAVLERLAAVEGRGRYR